MDGGGEEEVHSKYGTYSAETTGIRDVDTESGWRTYTYTDSKGRTHMAATRSVSVKLADPTVKVLEGILGAEGKFERPVGRAVGWRGSLGFVVLMVLGTVGVIVRGFRGCSG